MEQKSRTTEEHNAVVSTIFGVLVSCSSLQRSQQYDNTSTVLSNCEWRTWSRSLHSIALYCSYTFI